MAVQKTYLAVDLGASTGRVVAGKYDGRQLALEVVHRFDNGPVAAGGRTYWDVLRLWSEIQAGLREAAERFGAIQSVGVDTWGVDFALLGRHDELLGNPYHYRDPRTRGLLDLAFAVVPRREIFQTTGIQFMEINTLYQLWAMGRERSSLLDAAETFLMIPDLFHWLLTGEKVNERTNATTTQFLDAHRQDWARDLLGQFQLPTSILGPLAEPGTRLGRLRPEVAEACGLGGAEVVLPGSHDTASAVVAVPVGRQGRADPPDWCYISSGTWSLLGAEVARPVINDASLERNFTNEGGVGGTTRLLKNIAGLWLLQECRRIWQAQGQTYSWDELVALAGRASAFRSIVNPNDPMFLAPADMPETIREFCRRSGQPAPEDAGQVIRCALESLALCYRQVFSWLEELVGGRIDTIHIVGGGTQNQVLCQMTADACKRIVKAGPVEATALGNLAVQAMAAGDVAGIEEARQLIAASFPVQTYEPGPTEGWDEAFGRFEQLRLE